MTPARWRQINSLFQEALDRSSPERTAFLDEACADDEDSRKEVQSLISFHQRAQDFLEVPALEAAVGWLADDQADSRTGQLIGSYKIGPRLGRGGMGEVYLAEDTKLGRKVAIKFLAIELEEDDLARRRQIREAKAAARLDHPNICGIHEVVREANHSFIVMQYVEGETLAARIRRGSLELSESLDIALQVADALSLAHSRGIIHRDIKPQNIMITPRGQAKVLDFGLVKLIPSEVSDGNALDSYQESRLSETGMIVGTAGYMSPEQVKGNAVDARSDIFSLGVVLYECVTGKPAFGGNTPVEICAQVIQADPPPPSQVNPSVPRNLDRVILKALAKDPDLRYESAGQLIEDLSAVRDGEGMLTRPLALKPRSSSREYLTSLVTVARRPRVLMPAIVVALAALSVPLWWRAVPHRPSPEALHWYDLGTAALRDGTYYKASKVLERAIQSDDKFALAHARLAEAWSEMDYADKANLEVLQARSLVRDLSPLPQLDALYLQAITHVVLREFGLAIESYRKIAEQAPEAEKAQAYLDIGRAQEKNDEAEKAIESYERAAGLATQEPATFLHLGILYGRQQDLERARDAFQKAEEFYQALSNLEGVAEVFYQRARLLINLHKLPEARAQLEGTLEITSTTANDYQQIRALLALSSVSATEGNAIQAEEQATQAITLARADHMENQATAGLIWLGNSFNLRGEYSDAEKYYKEALDLARRDNGRENEAWALFSLGSVRSQQHDTAGASSYLEQALPFYRKGGYRKYLSLGLTLLGRTYRDNGDYEDALRVFNEQLQLGEQVGDLSQVALSHEGIGNVLLVQELYSEALPHFDKNYEINRSQNTGVYVGYAAIGRASVLWQIGRYEETRAALDEASSIAQRPQGVNKQLLAYIHLINARTDLSNGKLQESKVKSRQALELAGTQNKDAAVQAKYTLGLAQARSTAAPAGTRFCEQAVDMATLTGDPQLLSSALLAWAEAMLENGDARRALETALQAQNSFARFGRQESEWRAWLVAARASQQLGEESAVRQYASYADARLSNLEQKWGAEAYNGYLARPDIQHSRGQLGQLLKP